ncbi:unnamed protein product, partial [Discosporangium mesarthrocarpum]
MEYIRTNNLSLARNFLLGALSLCPMDPLVINELGVVGFEMGFYEEAAQRFKAALGMITDLP